MNEDQIKHMALRFLCWKLPKPFRPDNFISFAPPKPINPGTPYENDLWPTGTNLFGYSEAVEMVRHMLEGLPSREPVAWLYWPSADNNDLPFSLPHKVNMNPRYWSENPIYGPGETGDDRPICVGCGNLLEWSDDRWVSDEDGVTGCPACFTENGAGECWHRDMLSAHAIEAGTAETGTGSVHESAVHAPISPSEDQTNEPG